MNPIVSFNVARQWIDSFLSFLFFWNKLSCNINTQLDTAALIFATTQVRAKGRHSIMFDNTHDGVVTIQNSSPEWYTYCQQLYFRLLSDLDNLKGRLIQLSAEYRTLGQEFYNLPWSLTQDDRIDSQLQGFAHYQFHISPNRELPSMIQSLGTVEFTLQKVRVALNPSGIVELELTMQFINMAERWLGETVRMMEHLRRTLAEFRHLWQTSILQGGPRGKGELPRLVRRRHNERNKWLQVLPKVGQW